MEHTKRILVGVDPGETHSGVAIVENGAIQKGINISNFLLIDFISSLKNSCDSFLVIIEDMRPYNMRISDNVINTIKFIGQIEWRLSSMGIEFRLFPRWEIKQWVFERYPEMAKEEVVKKIEYLAATMERKNGGIPVPRRRPSFVYINDRIVEKAIKMWWSIKKPKVGQSTPFGLKTHSWQGLAMITFYIEKHDRSALAKKASD